jgi:hypothetical protein
MYVFTELGETKQCETAGSRCNNFLSCCIVRMNESALSLNLAICERSLATWCLMTVGKIPLAKIARGAVSVKCFPCNITQAFFAVAQASYLFKTTWEIITYNILYMM